MLESRGLFLFNWREFLAVFRVFMEVISVGRLFVLYFFFLVVVMCGFEMIGGVILLGRVVVLAYRNFSFFLGETRFLKIVDRLLSICFVFSERMLLLIRWVFCIIWFYI